MRLRDDWLAIVDFLTGPRLRPHPRRPAGSRILAACVATLLVLLGAQLSPLPAAADQGALRLSQAPPRILGCDITIDIPKTVDCLRSAVDREVRRAEREVRRVADQQIGNLQTQLEGAQRAAAAAERQVKIEVAKAEAQANAQVRAAQQQLTAAQSQLAAAQQQAARLQQELANNAFMAQLEWQRALLTEIKKQQALFDCLARAGGNVDIGRTIQEFSTNPGNFAQARVNEVMRTVSTTLPAALNRELASLANGAMASSVDRTILIRRATDTMIRVADQLPGARCLLQQIPPQLRTQIEQAIGSTLTEAERQARTFVERSLLPAVQSGIAVPLRGGFEAVVRAIPSPVENVNSRLETTVPFLRGLTLSEREMRAVARGLLLERQYEAVIGSGTEAVNELARLLANANTPREAIEAARVKAESALRGTPDYDQLYAALGVELLRAVGHKYVDSPNIGHGGFLLNQGFSMLQLSSGTSQNVVAALCGLIPEVGGAICAYVMQIVVTVWNFAIVPTLRMEASNLIHRAMDTSMDRVREELKRGLKLADIKSRIGPADALVSAIPSEGLINAWANGFIDRDIKALNGFGRSIASLATAAAARTP